MDNKISTRVVVSIKKIYTCKYLYFLTGSVVIALIINNCCSISLPWFFAKHTFLKEISSAGLTFCIPSAFEKVRTG